MTTAALEAVGRLVGLGTREAHPVIFLFGLGDNLGFVLSFASDLDLRADSAGNQSVSLRE